MRPLRARDPAGRRFGLRAKLVTAITLVTTLAGTSLTAYFFVAAREDTITQLQARGRAVAEALAHTSRAGVVSNDTVGLSDLVEGARRHADVVYAMVTDVEGRLIAQTQTASLGGLDLGGIAKRGVGLPNPEFARVDAPGGATIFDVAAPVTITREDHASHGGEMSLFGLERPSPEQDTRSEVVGTAHVGMSMAATDLKIRGALVTTAAVLTAVLVFGLVLSFLIAHSVVRPIHAVITTSRAIAGGDLTRRLPVNDRGDELNDLARFFNDMTTALDDNRREVTELARVLAEQRNHERALGDIAVAITGTHSIPELVEQLFAKLADHLKAPAAIFHQVSGDHLVALAGIGVSRAELDRSSLRLGEGVAGQAALRRARVIVTDAPATESISAPILGERARLDAVVAQPLVFQEQLLGVVEIGLFRRPDAEVLSFLDRVTEQLAVAVNNLRSYQRAQELAAELRLRGAELAQQNEKLERAHAEIQRANQHKSAFLANMRHELRAPLNSILGFTRLVIRNAGNALPERQVENLQRVEKSGSHLLQLINDILDISQVEAGRMDVVPESFALSDLISDIMSAAAPLVGERAVALLEDVHPDLPPMHTDKTRLRQIILNIVSNAVKFTQTGEVRVSARFEAQGQRVVVAISDTGIGISPDNLGRIFEPFTQADESTTRQYGGTGLGLALVAKMVKLLGGEVNVESEVGRGSTFTLHIPVDAQTETMPPATRLHG